MSASAHHHYNPDWLSDDALLAGFVARQHDFAFLRDELAQAPLAGSVQHYLLVGVRGAGKTTLLKRLAVAIRRDDDLRDHLIGLSFPEELYQVKNLADFWWAACDALADALDALDLGGDADRLLTACAQARSGTDPGNATSDAGFVLLQQSCARLGRRAVLLVDNLDVVFARIDKRGRKLHDPHAPAYWALREALSTSTSPIVIGGSVRLSSPFTDYDKAFYDFFIPKRLGKLSLAEVRDVIERLADAQGVPDVKARLRERPGRIEALFELTGGNPRALGLIFELLRHGPNSHAVEDFERLMDLTTPYYKARIEDLSEQAQVIMHALAVRGVGAGAGDHLRFGHTAAEIGDHAGLPTSTVSAQLSILENEGLVEKSAAHGRTQYRIAEQMFRLWLQMRGTRRIRQNVLELTKFFEAMYDLDELQEKAAEDCGAQALSAAKFAMAVAAVRDIPAAQREKLENYATKCVREHVDQHGGNTADYLPADAAAARQLAAKYVERGILERRKGDFVEATAAFQQAISLDSTHAKAFMLLGELESQLGNVERARGLLEEALALSEREQTDLGRADALLYLGVLEGRLRNEERARSLYEEALALYQKEQDDLGRANACFYLGVLESRSDNVERTRGLFEEALALYQKGRDDLGRARALNALGYLESRLGNEERVRGLYEEAVALYQNIQDDFGHAGALLSLGDLESELGNVERARDLHENAAAIYQRLIILSPAVPVLWISLARVLETLQRDDAALEAYQRAADLDANLPSFWRAEQADLQARLCASAASKALATGDQAGLRDALTRLIAGSVDIAAVLVSRHVVEDFLAPTLTNAPAASMLLAEMRKLAYEKHARPLILAFEAAIENRANMLAELEPEIQAATKRMFERLSAGNDKQETPAKRVN